VKESAQPLAPTRPRFKPYPEYKDSGVEWLGEIPAHWEVKRLKDCLLRLESGGTPESDNFDYWTDDESGTPWVAISDMTRAFHVRETAKRLTEQGLRSKRLPILPSGTLLYSMYASLGKVALLKIDAVVNQAILGLVTRDDLASRDYLRWWLEFMQGHVQMLSSSNTQDNLNAYEVRKMPVFVPGPDAQSAIAAFLDRETARIDALVAKKERLIELLQQKRTALISRAVTKGLYPNVPMKDSGVEWLGKIPAHWGVLRISELTALLNGYPFDAEYFVRAGGTPLVRIRDLNATETEVNYNGPVVEDAWIESGDVIVGMDGDFNVARWRGQRALLNQRMCCLRPRNKTDAGFIAYLLPLPLRVINDLTYSTTVKHLSSVDVRKIRLGAPPEPEQRAIVAFLDRETARIDALVAKVRDAIERFKELRTALISAAVTGKFDVREEVA